MPLKPLDRHLFVQGELCFFCKQPLPKDEASVEHLVATAHGGKDNDTNCVACCKSLNGLFGSMSLKEKFELILKQKGNFRCPNVVAAARNAKVEPNGQPHSNGASDAPIDPMEKVLLNLRKRNGKLPGTVEKLTNTVAHALGIEASEPRAAACVAELQRHRKIIIHEDESITYHIAPLGEGTAPENRIANEVRLTLIV